MATTNLGRVGFVAKGDWVAGTYKRLDTVKYNGQLYICKVATTNNPPTNTTDWMLAAEKGADGSGSIASTTNVLKGDGTGNAIAAVAGTDFVKPDTESTWTAKQTFKELKDTVYTITDAPGFQIDPENGSIQVVTLGASRSPSVSNFEDGQSLLLGINSSSYAVTWPSITWVKAGGNASAPTLSNSDYTWILLWKVDNTVYGSEVGAP